MWMLVPDLVRRETADEVGKAVAAAYQAGHDACGLDQPEAHRHAPYVPEKMLDAWKVSGHNTEEVLGAFLRHLALSPEGASLTAAEVYGRWEEMKRAAAAEHPA
jgi:hypothetical protein